MNKLLKIKLLSDLCSGSGDTFNSRVDTDVVYDDYGLPFIPAKRIKGCIRESLLELIDFGVYDDNLMDQLFGGEGDRSSAFSLSDAKLQEHDAYIKALSANPYPPQEVLELFSYARTQTSIDPETGTAEENHLRTKRVVKKGLTFEAKVNLDSTLSDEAVDAFAAAASNVTHIGINRTRGLGLISVEIEDDADGNTSNVSTDNISEGKNVIEYTINVQSPVLCKSPEGNQAKTQPYFEGNKILGLIARNMKQDEFLDLMASEPVFTTAYKSVDGKRTVPVSCSVQKIKDAAFKDNVMSVVDQIYSSDESDTKSDKSIQYSGVGDLYVTGDGYVTTVDTEINYHHKRPDDKSVGHATGKDGSAFYQLESIRPGQSFKGYIVADGAQAGKIRDAFGKLKDVRMGYSRNSQYGSVIVSLDSIKSEDKITVNGDFIVRVNAPIIMYNDNGMNSSDKDTFREYLAVSLGLSASNLKIDKSSVTYETVGGFNVTQKSRKPILGAIGRGSVYKIHTDKSISNIPSHLFIGERITEGYGEIEITPFAGNKEMILKKPELAAADIIATSDNGIIAQLEKREEEKVVIRTARDDARKIEIKSSYSTTVAKLLMIYKEQPSFALFNSEKEQIANDGKLKDATKILKGLNERYKETYYKLYVGTFLWELKYRLRAAEEEEGKK